VRSRAVLVLLAVVLGGGCATSGGPQPARDDEARSGSPSPYVDECRLPVAQRTGGWVCPTSTGDLVPADSDLPAAGSCGSAPGALAVVDANPDTPQPRCLVVRTDQRLEVVNTSDRFQQPGTEITVTMPGFPSRVLAIGASTVFDRPFGAYLAPGVHRLRISLYSGSGADLWLKDG
jgi:hypothetical protein